MLVEYSDSESGGDEGAGAEPSSMKGPSSRGRKRKLPPLQTTESSLDAADVKKQKGDWLCHAFLALPPRTDLSLLLAKVRKRLQITAPWLQQHQPYPGESWLHISVSRPIVVRPHERDYFVQAVKKALMDFKAPHASFARFAHFVNEDRSKGFLAIEVGHGHEELESMSFALDTALNNNFKARPYHSDKRFHSSFMSTSSSSASSILSSSKGEDQSSPSIAEPDPESEEVPSKLQIFRVHELERLAEDLNSRHGAELRALSPFKLPQLGIRVGNRVTWVQLA